ncbi:protein FAR1-RELATED SEQUENCE 5-like [Phalaenopsis equestris]|uniref:protein FAR1-RELATED SEQUENCE 5-like n=1 Tax=Phalaenopsis equestris TaxID=78828 RepID=UPI0009E420C3|nr:protein FAR1-RELATED SEQUENCE 5-like [Phalaenopsis equestris]
MVHNEKEAYEVYFVYAHHIGFSVRKDHATFWTNSKNIKTKDFVCGKVGFKKELKIIETVKYIRAETRTGCPAMIRYRVDEKANPVDKHSLRSSRKISEVNADVLRSMTQSGIRPKDAFNFLAQEVGGVENLECIKTDAFNFIQRERRCRIENGDVNTLLQLFVKRRAEDSIISFRLFDLLNLKMGYDYKECQFMFDAVHDVEGEDGRYPD